MLKRLSIIALIIISFIIPGGLVNAFGPAMDANYDFDSGFSNDIYSVVYNDNSSAQTFTIGSRDVTVSSIKIYGKRTLLPGSTTLSVYTSAGTGVALTTATLDADAWSTSPEWIDFDVSDYMLSANTIYSFCLRSNTGDIANYTSYGTDNTVTSYSGGNYMSSIDDGATWTSNTSFDMGFEIYGYMSNSQNHYSGTNDGELYDNDIDYDTCRNSSTGTVNDLDMTASVGQNNVSPIYSIYRTALFFDTSSIPSTATISSVTLYIYGESDNSVDDFDITIVGGSNIVYPMTSSGYHSIYDKTISLGSINTSTYSVGAYNGIVLNASGLAQISRDGVTSFALRSSNDIAGIAPNLSEYVTIYTGEKGSGYAPYLSVAYTDSVTLANPDYVNIYGAKVFNHYNVVGDKLFCILYNVEYSAGNPTKNPSDYFNIQLISGSTVIAQTKIPAWGMSPGSIYLGVNSSITWGGAYNIRIMGTSLYTSPTSVTYEILATDWGGDASIANSPLDKWVRASADAISLYYTVTLSEYLQTTWVLNQYGGALFEAGIPGLNSIRPDIFREKVISWAGDPPDNSTFAYQNTLDSTVSLGARTKAALNALGTEWGVGGNFLGGFIWGGVMLIVCGVVVWTTGSVIAGLVLSIPVLIVGSLLGLIPLAFIVILGILCSGGIVYTLWGKTG